MRGTLVGTEAHVDLDRSALERLYRFGGAALLDEMIRLFVAVLPERLEAARAITTGGDAAVAERALHSLKSGSGQLGAMRLHRLSAAGEQSVREGAGATLAPLLDDIAQESTRVREWLAGDGRRGIDIAQESTRVREWLAGDGRRGIS
jgi:HPt (histidine-containing phosphotransfer) domain-containing protein